MSRAAYDEIANWYDAAVREGPLASFHEWMVPIVLDLAGDVRRLRVCDLACGQGIVSRRLAALGASVVGVDVSERLLQTARCYEQEEPLGVSYRLSDARALDGLNDADFDGVVCSMALMDIPDLDATLRAVSRVLRPDGWFVFSVVHPIFQTPGSPWWAREEGSVVGVEVRGYFTEGFWQRDSDEGLRGKVGAYHRTLSTYVNALVRSGLSVECLLEPEASGRLAESSSIYEDVPLALLARCVKRGSASV